MDANKEGDHSLNLEANLGIGDKKKAAPAADTATNLVVILDLSHGVILKQASGFAVFAGSNNRFMYRGTTTTVGTTKVDASEIFINVGPNIEFQKMLGKGFETFSGAGVNVTYDSKDGGTTVGTSSAFFTTGADVSTGLRWNYENFALEGKITDALLFNGPDMIGGKGPGLFGEVGLAVGF